MMIKFYDILISMDYIPDTETIREGITGSNIKSVFYNALSSGRFSLGESKQLVSEWLQHDPQANLRFLLCYKNIQIRDSILETANLHPDFYPLTIKLIGQHKSNMSSFPDIPISYADFYAIDRGEHFLLRNELEKFAAMVRESPILSQIYNIDAESRVSDPRIGLARSNLLLQSEAFKYETSEIFSKIRQYNTDERIRMDNMRIPSSGYVIRAIRKDQAIKLWEAANGW